MGLTVGPTAPSVAMDVKTHGINSFNSNTGYREPGKRKEHDSPNRAEKKRMAKEEKERQTINQE